MRDSLSIATTQTSDPDYVTFETHVYHHHTFSPLALLDAVAASHLFVMLMIAICTVGHKVSQVTIEWDIRYVPIYNCYKTMHQGL